MILELRSKVHSKEEELAVREKENKFALVHYSYRKHFLMFFPCQKLTGYVEYVQKMAVAISEISYLSGMDNLSLALSQRTEEALRNIKEEVNSITALEQEYCRVQEECIKHSEHTVFAR